MTIAEKVKAVEEVFEKLDAEIASFQRWSGLSCKTGCSRCCFKPDIAATVLEFLPFAYYLYRNGLAESWHEKLRQTEESLCLLLNQVPSANVGACTEYPHRGLICRLFGFSARKDKYDKKELVTCQVIKSEQSESYQKTVSGIQSEVGSVPMMSHFHMQLMAVDAGLARNLHPINEAIRLAVEEVLSYYAYREGVE